MTQAHELQTTASEARRAAIMAIEHLSPNFTTAELTPAAKIHTAHAIAHFANATASLTTLRRELKPKEAHQCP